MIKLKIGVDKAQQAGKHDLKHNQLIAMGHELIDIPVPVGDYIEITEQLQEVIDRRGSKLKKMDLIGPINISVDTKRDIEELYQCLVQGHSRFSDTCLLAQNNGIRLIILIENRNRVASIDELGKWKNENGWKRYYAAKKKAERMGVKPPKSPNTPTQLKKTMWTMNKKYGTEFLFCRPDESAGKIIELLTGGKEVE